MFSCFIDSFADFLCIGLVWIINVPQFTCSFPLEPMKILPSASHTGSCLKNFKIPKSEMCLYSSGYILTPLFRQGSHWWKGPGWIPSSEHALIFTHTHTNVHMVSVHNTHPTYLCYGLPLPLRNTSAACTLQRQQWRSNSMALAHWSWVSWGQVPSGWGPVCILWCPSSPEKTLRFPWAERFPHLPPAHL